MYDTNYPKPLTCTNGYRTLCTDSQMDETSSKLVARLRVLEVEGRKIEEEKGIITRALEIAGIRPTEIETAEGVYAKTRPFRKMSLVDACKRVLTDSEEEWITKSQVDYLITRGGFESLAKDAKNSIDVTLRRLAAEGFCEVDSSRGKLGNKYKFSPKNVAP